MKQRKDSVFRWALRCQQFWLFCGTVFV